MREDERGVAAFPTCVAICCRAPRAAWEDGEPRAWQASHLIVVEDVEDAVLVARNGRFAILALEFDAAVEQLLRERRHDHADAHAEWIAVACHQPAAGPQ